MPISQVITLMIVMAGLIVGLVSFIFRGQVARISSLSRRQGLLEALVTEDLASMKTDISWIKEKLKNI